MLMQRNVLLFHDAYKFHKRCIYTRLYIPDLQVQAQAIADLLRPVKINNASEALLAIICKRHITVGLS